MKVLIVPSWYPNVEGKSHGIFFVKQAELLSQKHEIRVLVGKENLIGYKKSYGRINSLFNSDYRDTKFFIDELAAVRLHQFEFDNFTFFSSGKSQKKLVDTFEKYYENVIMPGWVPDIIHAHDVFYAGLVASRLKSSRHIPFVLTSHNPINYDRWSAEQTADFKKNLVDSDVITTVSDFDKRIILNSVQQDVRPITIGNYIDDGFFELKTKNEHSPFALLCIASTSRRKDFPTLFETIRRVKQKASRPFVLHLTVLEVKDGVTMEEIVAMINNEGVKDVVKMYSNLSDQELLKMHQDADLFVSSSYYETFGVAVAEALCCGTPVVAVDNGGIRDIVESGTNGILVPTQDAEGLAENILKCMSGELSFDPVNVRNSIVNKFGTRAYLDRLTNIYEKVLNDRRN